MKKLLITLSILLTGVYLTSAINIDLLSGSKLDIFNWQNIGNITNKINLGSNNLNIKGKLVTNFKICSGENCLGECDTGKIWDTNTTSCVVPATTPETAGKDCADILANNLEAPSGDNYYIKPDGYTGAAFKVYCDMRDDGGRTMVFRGLGNWNSIDFDDCVNNKIVKNEKLYCIYEGLFDYSDTIKQQSFGNTETEVKRNFKMEYLNGNRPSREGRIRGIRSLGNSTNPLTTTEYRPEINGCWHNGAFDAQSICLGNVWYIK